MDLVVNTALKKAVFDLEQRGFNNLCVRASAPPPREEAPLREAIDRVRLRGLQDHDNNAQLIKSGERWLRTLEVERYLANSVESCQPVLRNLYEKAQWTGPAVAGTPWQCTNYGREMEGTYRTSAWKRTEELAEAIKAAKVEKASDQLLLEASKLLAQLVARTKELPSDRCVLDPEGEGIRLLPMGKQRAVWKYTGDVYMYEQQAEQGGNLGDAPPPRAELGTVSVDEARPVCAEFADKGRCRHGKRCPWRHCVPKPGDTIKEAFVFEEEP